MATDPNRFSEAYDPPPADRPHHSEYDDLGPPPPLDPDDELEAGDHDGHDTWPLVSAPGVVWCRTCRVHYRLEASTEIQLASDVDVPHAGYDIARTKLRGRSLREDWLVASTPPSSAVEQADFVDRLRWFFAEMDAEVDRYRDDPIATASALARVEALLGDVRYVRDRLRSTTAASMERERIRRLTVSGVVQVEASATTDRTGWQHERLLRDLLVKLVGPTIITPDDGQMFSAEWIAEVLLGYLRPEWRLTPLREVVHLEPNDYCADIVRTPTVQIKDNRVKGQRR